MWTNSRTGDDHTVKIRLKHKKPTRDRQINNERSELLVAQITTTTTTTNLCVFYGYKKSKWKQESYTKKCEVSQSTKSKQNIERTIKVPHTENAHVQIVLSAIIRMEQWPQQRQRQQHRTTKNHERKKFIRIHSIAFDANNETR